MQVGEKVSEVKEKAAEVKDEVAAKALDAKNAGVAAAAALGSFLATQVKHLGVAKAGRVAVKGVAKQPLIAAAVLAAAGALYLWNKRHTATHV